VGGQLGTPSPYRNREGFRTATMASAPEELPSDAFKSSEQLRRAERDAEFDTFVSGLSVPEQLR